MTTDQRDELAEESREGNRIRYEVVLNLVRERTAEDMRPTISQFDLLGRLRQKGVPHDYAETAIQAALDNDDLVSWSGPDGRRQLATLSEASRLRRAIKAEADREHPRKDVTGFLNRRLQEVRDGDE